MKDLERTLLKKGFMFFIVAKTNLQTWTSARIKFMSTLNEEDMKEIRTLTSAMPV